MIWIRGLVCVGLIASCCVLPAEVVKGRKRPPPVAEEVVPAEELPSPRSVEEADSNLEKMYANAIKLNEGVRYAQKRTAVANIGFNIINDDTDAAIKDLEEWAEKDAEVVAKIEAWKAKIEASRKGR